MGRKKRNLIFFFLNQCYASDALFAVCLYSIVTFKITMSIEYDFPDNEVQLAEMK